MLTDHDGQGYRKSVFGAGIDDQICLLYDYLIWIDEFVKMLLGKGDNSFFEAIDLKTNIFRNIYTSYTKNMTGTATSS